MARYGLLAAAIAAGAAAQAVPTIDSKTGITFAAFKDEVNGAQFGIALPQTFSGDFIGQLVAPTGNSTGWVGMSLGSGMLNNLLVAAWPNEQEILSTFRLATDYAAPGPYPGANFTQTPIATGTFVNGTHYSYTFLCSGCLSVQPNFQGDVTGTGLGWALSTNELGNTASANTTLNFHNAGQGVFVLSFADAQSARFAEWAALAGSGSGNDTAPIPTNPDDNDDGDEGTPGPTAPFPTASETATATETDAGPTTTSRSTRTPRPTGGRPTRTRTRTRSARPTTRSRTTTTRSSRPTSTGRVRQQAAPFRPAFNPDAVSGSDFEDAQRFKASFLDGYYKGSDHAIFPLLPNLSGILKHPLPLRYSVFNTTTTTTTTTCLSTLLQIAQHPTAKSMFRRGPRTPSTPSRSKPRNYPGPSHVSSTTATTSSPSTPSRKTSARGLFLHGRWHCDCACEPRLPAERFRVKKEGKNKGRWFYTCQNAEGARCGFFLWEEEAKVREEGALFAGTAGEKRARGHGEANPEWLRGMAGKRKRDDEVVDLEAETEGEEEGDGEGVSWPATAEGTPSKKVKVVENVTPAKGRRLPWLDYEEDGVKISSGGNGNGKGADGMEERGNGLPTPMTRSNEMQDPRTSPTTGRFRDAMRSPPGETIALSSSTLSTEVLELLKTSGVTLPERVRADLTSTLSRHEMKLQGVIKGRDLVRTALRSKEGQLVELKGRVAGLEAEREVLRGALGRLRGPDE
ncbi:hypothetical protein CAC42_5055 [Sphaceloma murrayae]|uniref:GRF-type domain-containing protein n=1 Tax=Sphaceloma murrayae TaxID=2082308 RepID=A0A2K1QTX2_9PEZI|nr:hypothetical protein CAC42_5055 [Sphaceloma murrayae]